jgi:conjugal transfer pilus assembly protein TraU
MQSIKSRTASLILLMFLLLGPVVYQTSYADCVGKFVNPITDICWGCVMPITLGGEKAHITFKQYGGPKGRDIKNPEESLCMCNKKGVPAVPGVPIGFWEPIRLIEVTRTPFCMVGLGGIKVGSAPSKVAGAGAMDTHSSFYHLHYYMYPLIAWLELITDFLCLETGTFDLAYMSEFDPSWKDSEIANLLNPESFLFGNPIAQALCAGDCVAANIDMPIDMLPWCAGCLGSMYPWGGHNSDHYGGVQSSNLLAIRAISKMHRVGLTLETSTTDASVNGKICVKRYTPKLKKSQYKLQMAYPVFRRDSFCCHPLGMTDFLHSSGREFPVKGEDFVYILWRKINCCLL